MEIRAGGDHGSLQPNSYADFLADLKKRIQAAQVRAVLSVNRELVVLYWQIGCDILDRQERESWFRINLRRFSSTARPEEALKKVSHSLPY